MRYAQGMPRVNAMPPWGEGMPVVFGIWIVCLAMCHQSGVGECKGVLDTLARGIVRCCAVLGMLHHGMRPWGRRCQKGYLLVPWYLYRTTTAALHKPSGLVPVSWAHLDLAV